MTGTTEAEARSAHQIAENNRKEGWRAFIICFLSSKHPPLDKRVFDKEAVSLAQAGFDVVHLAPGAEQARYEQNVRIVTYRPPQGIVGRILQIPRLYTKAAAIDADFYHCNEVDSWFVGVLLKLIRRKRIVFDVHEHYPSTFAESRFPTRLRPHIANLIRLIFRSLIPFTDRIVFAKQSVAVDFVGSEAKQVLVQNFTALGERAAEQFLQTTKHAENAEAGIRAIHLGLISRARGWPQLLDALAQTTSTGLRLHIIGTFNDQSKADFDQRVVELGLDQRITVEQWMPFEAAYQHVAASDIGLVLFQPGIQNHVWALPHKMFDYMMAELPIIAPRFAEEVSRIVREADCGILVDPADPDEIAQALDALASNPAERQRLGRNGRKAVLERYNWESQADRLIQMYNEMAGTSA